MLISESWATLRTTSPMIWSGADITSGSKIAIAFSDFTIFVWLGLMLKASPFAAIVPQNCGLIIVFIFTIVYIAAMLIRCVPDPPQSN
jgi:hypothetical protein